MRNKSSTPVVKYESEADDTVQVLRFERADKKDIVMVNWQAHVAHAIGMYPASITADLVHHVRKTVEEENDDALLAYYQGASGNINLTVKVPKSGKYDGNYKKVGEALGDIILKTLDKNMQKVEAGKIYSTSRMLTFNYRSISDEDLARANEVVAAGPEGSAAYNAKLDELGFESHYEVSRIISLAPQKGSPSSQYVAAIGFGDVGFASIPYEMFDTNGMELKEASPYKMTFVLTCSGGMVGYVPSALSVPNKGYEVVVSNFEYGTAEMVVGEMTEMLKKVFESK